MISAADVHKRFGKVEVLRGVSLNVAPHQTSVIIGPSGSGKSTFLRCCNGLEVPDQGLIRIDGKDVFNNGKSLPDLELDLFRANVGMVFQAFNLFPHMTVLENVMLGPLRVKQLSRSEAEARAMDLLKKVNLEEKRDSHPNALSGGQKQRVAIARALALEPNVMLFDEPTSSLDPELASEVLQTMRNLAQDGMTMLVVTHEMEFAREVANFISVMVFGKIIECEKPSVLFSNPREERTHTFLKRGGWIKG